MRRAALPLALALGVLVLCSIPGASLPRVRLLTVDKLAHIIMFAGLGWAWLRAYPDRPRWVLLGGTVFAVLTEVWQSTLPIGRTGEVADAVADVIGLAMAAGAWFVLRRRAGVGA